MLILWRKNSQWLTITHRETGQKVRIKVFGACENRVGLAFEDIPNNFNIQRDERIIEENQLDN